MCCCVGGDEALGFHKMRANSCLPEDLLTSQEGLHSLELAVYRGADKSLGRPGRKQATATEDFDFHISYL